MWRKYTLAALISLLCAANLYADSTQAELDAACEAAREKKLAPLRNDMIQECIDKGERDEAGCKRYYADWDGGRGKGLSKQFYDLPECEAAFEHQRDSARR